MTRHDAVQLLNSVAAVRSQTTANRHFTCLARLLSLAHQWGFVPENVARGVKKFREQLRKERFLSPEEVRKLDAALRAQKNAVAAGAVRLLLWTGMRRGEATGLLWEDVTLEGDAPSLYLRQTKSGRPRTVPLNTAALQVLRKMLKCGVKGNPHVFPRDNDRGHVWDLRWLWGQTKKACGLEDSLRLHDLRHSFASSLVQNGTSLCVIQKLLGHETPIMAQRYSAVQGCANAAEPRDGRERPTWETVCSDWPARPSRIRRRTRSRRDCGVPRVGTSLFSSCPGGPVEGRHCGRLIPRGAPRPVFPLPARRGVSDLDT